MHVTYSDLAGYMHACLEPGQYKVRKLVRVTGIIIIGVSLLQSAKDLMHTRSSSYHNASFLYAIHVHMQAINMCTTNAFYDASVMALFSID